MSVINGYHLQGSANKKEGAKMTIKELIAKLSEFPENMVVGISATKNHDDISGLEISSWEPNTVNIIGKESRWY